MKKLILLLLIFISGKISAQTFPVTTILYNGPSSNHFDLVFLADGFTSAEQTNFITQVNTITTTIFSTSPYNSYKNLFNVYAIQVNSSTSGIMHQVTATDCASANPNVPSSGTVSYFGSKFDYGNIHRLVVATNTTAIQNVLLANFPAYNKAIVVANSTYYGGSGGTYPCCTINNASSEIIIHELGHSIANLTDEYTSGGCGTIEKPNCTMETNPTLIKWKAWIPGGMPIPTPAATNCTSVGLYLGSNYCPSTWYRPMCNCKMLALGQSFCSICKEELIVSFLNMTNLVNSYSPVNTSTINIASGGSQNFSSTIIQTIPNTIKSQWLLDGVVVGTNILSYTSIGNNLITGIHTLTFNVWDTTSLVKKLVPTNSVSWTIYKSGTTTVTLSTFNPVCVNASSFTLTGGSPTGGTYSGTGVSAGIFNPAIAGAGTFTINYTYNSQSASQTIQVKALPVVTVSPTSTSICSGTSTTITASGATTYSWSPSTALNSTTAVSATASPTSSITYTITGTTNGCSSSSTKSVIVITLPTLTISGSNAICNGSSTTLTVNGATTYSWSPATGLNLTSGTTVIANPTSSLTYAISGTANGCTKIQNFTLAVNSIPTITSSVNTTICSGTSTTLTAGGATTYTWSPSTALNVTTGSSVMANPTSNITYTITGSNGCTSTKTVSVSVNALPTVSVSGNNSTCSGSSVNLTASGAITYTWSPSTGLSVTTGTMVSATPISTITYSITGTAANGCTKSFAKTITVNASPIVSTSGNIAMCTGSSTTLTGSGATTYSWSPSTGLNITTGSSVNANPVSSTTYTVIGTSNGCTNTKTIAVTVSSGLVLSVSGASSICSGSSTSLTVTGASTYTWSPSTSLNTTMGATVSSTPISNITYTISGTSGACNASKTVALFVNASPTISVSGNSTTCSGTSTNLTASGASTYSWSPSTGLNLTSGSSVVANPVSAITYSITGTAANGCAKTSTKIITVNALPSITYTSTNPTSGQSNGAINITVSGGQTPYTYLWSNGATTEDLTTVAAGTFTITVTSSGGCIKTQSVILTNTSSNCNVTSTASFMNTNSTSTIAMWGSVTGAYKYNLRTRPVGSTLWTLQSTNGNNTAATVSGLMPTTQYEIQIQTQCDAAGTNLSAFSASYNFTTSAAARMEVMENENNLDFGLFPNPTSDIIHLELSNPGEETYDIRIYDMAGREMKIESMEKGQTELLIQLQDFPQGLYSLVIIGQNLREVRKMLKQ